MSSVHLHTAEEKSLFQRLSQNDEEAYTKLFHLFTPRLFPYLLKITKNEILSKELLQEIFLILWEKRSDFDKIENPASWLFRVAANTSLMHLRTIANRHKLDRKIVYIAPEIDNAALAKMEEEEINRVLIKAIAALPPKRKQIYTLSRENGFTHQQIAEQLKLSVQTVKNQIGISLKFIQEFLHKECDTLVVIVFFLC